MRQVVSIGVGKCGISIQEQQWKILLEEQGLDVSGVIQKQNAQSNIESYFKEVKEGIYKPRSVLADTDHRQIEILENGNLNKFFMGNHMIFSSDGCSNLFAKGHYTTGAEMKDQIEDCIRQEAECCDSIDSFQMQRSTCGGSGSGVGSIVLQILRESYCADIVNSLVHFPDEASKNVIEIYNTILALHHQIELTDLVLPFLNDSIQQLVDNSISSIQKSQNFEDINMIAAQIHPGFTCNLRYPGSLNATSRKICTNLLPFPRLKIMSICNLPFNYYKSHLARVPEYEDMIEDSFNTDYFIFNKDKPDIFCSQNIFRGGDIHEIEFERKFYDTYKQAQTTYWIPNSLSISYCNQPTIYNSKQLLCFINNRSVVNTIKLYAEKFTNTFRRKGFLHWFTSEGMDEMEFTEAESNANDLISELTPYDYNYYDEEEGDFGEYE